MTLCSAKCLLVGALSGLCCKRQQLWQPVLQGLGIGMVAASFVLKVPQILAIARSGSAAGLSTLSFELEQVGLSVHTAYGFLLGLPFNAFGEACAACHCLQASVASGLRLTTGAQRRP